MATKTSLRDYQRDLSARLQSAGAGRVASKLGLQVGGERWLVDLTEAAEVIPVPPITPVPLTQPWYRGVASIRGNLFSVVDFPAYLGGAQTARSEASRILLLAERYRMHCALLVDCSLGLRHPEQLRRREPEGPRPPWVRAEYEEADGVRWTELDVPQLLQQPDFLAVGLGPR